MEIFKKLINAICFCICFIILSSIFSSCSKSDESDDFSSGQNKGMINVSVEGIEDGGEYLNLKSSSSVESKVTLAKTTTDKSLTSELNMVGNFVFDVGSEQFDIASDDAYKIPLNSSKLKATNLKRAATVNMASTTKFWLLIYNIANNQCVYSEQLTASPVTSFTLPFNNTYRWFAFSYNDNVNIDEPDENDPIIRTKVDKPFLYSSGTFNAVQNVTSNLSIVFKHKLTQLKMQVTVTDDNHTFTIGNLKAEFVGDYIKTSDFNLKTGKRVIQSTGVSVGDLVFTGTSNVKVSKAYYTADSLLTGYQVRLKELSIGSTTYVEDDFPNDGVAVFSPYTNVVGKILLGRLSLNHMMPIRRILHYGTLNSEGIEAWLTSSASGRLIREEDNYGPNSSRVRIRGLEHRSASNTAAGNLRTAILNEDPHIIIASMSSSTSVNDYNALLDFLDAGGQVLMMSSETGTATRDFLRTAFGDASLALSRPDASGSVYKWVHYLIFDRQDGKKYSNGSSSKYIEPFGDSYAIVGCHNTNGMTYMSYSSLQGPIGYTYYATNLPTIGARLGKIVAAGRSDIYEGLNYIGDSHFLANGSNTPTHNRQPFVVNSNNLPAIKAYGAASDTDEAIDYDSRGRSNGGWQTENAKVFANLFAWMLYQSVYVSGM